MGTGKAVETTKGYARVAPGMGYYLKNKNIPRIYKHKCPLIAAAGEGKGRIELFTNSLEHMGSLCTYTSVIWCICPIPTRILAAGSGEKNIKIWNIEKRSIISILSGHKDCVTALCYVREGQLVSGSGDKSLIVWSKLPANSTYSNYSQTGVLTGHASGISGIIKVNNREIISGDIDGDLRMWNIDQGICIRHIPNVSDYCIYQMRQHMGEVAVSYGEKVIVWGAANNWQIPLKQFVVCSGSSIEFLSGDFMLRGGVVGQLEFVDYAQTGCSLPLSIKFLHLSVIYDIQYIAKNIVATVSEDRTLKVIDPIARKCYLNYNKGDQWLRAIAYLY